MKNSSFSGGNLGSVGSNRGSGKCYSESETQSITVKSEIEQSHHIAPLMRLILNIKAYFRIKGIKSALKEVELIEKGAKKPKSLDQLLNEL